MLASRHSVLYCFWGTASRGVPSGSVFAKLPVTRHGSVIILLVYVLQQLVGWIKVL